MYTGASARLVAHIFLFSCRPLPVAVWVSNALSISYVRNLCLKNPLQISHREFISHTANPFSRALILNIVKTPQKKMSLKKSIFLQATSFSLYYGLSAADGMTAYPAAPSTSSQELIQMERSAMRIEEKPSLILRRL